VLSSREAVCRAGVNLHQLAKCPSDHPFHGLLASQLQCKRCGYQVQLPTIMCAHTHTHNHFTAVWILSGTTQMSWYQKKHSPTHTYPGHKSSLNSFLHLLRSMASYLFDLCVTLFFHKLSPCFLWSNSSGTLNFILHTFLYPIIVFFSQHMPIPLQPVPL